MPPDLQELRAALTAAREKRERLNKDAQDAAVEADLAEEALLDALDAMGLESVRIDGVHYSAKETKYAQITDRDELMAWLRESPEADEDLVQIKPVARNLNELVRSKLANGEELPPGVTFRPKRYVSITST